MESPARIEHATARCVPSRSLAMGTVVVAVLQLNACSSGVSERTRAPSGEQSSPGIARPTYEGACSPPATRLSFVSTRRGMEQIYRIDIRRPEEVSRVTRLPGFAMDHTWSPDGSRLAFRWFRGGRVAVFVANADGTDVQLLVDEAAMPDWSPDGRLIAFANLRDRGISVVDVEKALRGGESAVRIVTRSDQDIPEEQPVWSPDGRQIAFTSHRAGTPPISGWSTPTGLTSETSPRIPLSSRGQRGRPTGRALSSARIEPRQRRREEISS